MTGNPPPKKGWFVKSHWIIAVALVVILLPSAVLFRQSRTHNEKHQVHIKKTIIRPLLPSETTAVLGVKGTPDLKIQWHPPHVMKVWLTTFRGRTYRVTQLPRCEHLEALIRYNPRGETLSEARKLLGGIAASTGSFHHPKSMVLADFLQREGKIICPARTGRCFVTIDGIGVLNISGDYESIKGDPRYSAIALGQRLVPLMRDGFTLAFMNQITDRMAVGLNKSFIFIVQGKTSIWRLSEFMSTQLPINSAINCDGGHVVRGKGPVHIVFRWKKTN